MPALTETEATGRAAFIDVASYDVFADLTAEPVRSRTEIRFGCREPGAATFAELTATATSGGDLRAGLLRTLAARGLATEEDLEALAADPVGGARNLVTCRALRPDAAAKAAAWEMALDRNQDRRTAEAAAHGIWVPGQEAVLGPLLAGYRERYFAEALPALDAREIRVMRRLAGRCTRPRWPSPPRWRRPRPRRSAVS